MPTFAEILVNKGCQQPNWNAVKQTLLPANQRVYYRTFDFPPAGHPAKPKNQTQSQNGKENVHGSHC